ncbi:Hsp33 family molecular chaperone HslO [Sneathiella glossodoripedis]|uniref:Hsp33 family molecular chaperone HslO n=1 Tax=Sneathiella glossodoripedis TaxID=418853 RepID=UPI00046FCA82|nr:Hsp33 family molecular chaperone HslO [Sneathiella glossodoripedis]
MTEQSEPKAIADNLIQPFQMAEAGVRGRIVRLGKVVDDILNRHKYPDSVARLLGESLVLAAMLGGSLKFDGIFTVQCKGDGAINLLAADMTTPGSLRGYAGFDEAKLMEADKASGDNLVNRYLGTGYVAFTIDTTDTGKRYQGIVELEGDSLAQCMENYFARSEQIETRLKVAVEKQDGKWRAGGLMIQRLPEDSKLAADLDAAKEAWANAEALVNTVMETELTHSRLRSSELLYRLFHEDGVWLYDTLELLDNCSCSSERVLKTLISFSDDNLAEMADDGVITVDCQFCSAQYKLTVQEIQENR